MRILLLHIIFLCCAQVGVGQSSSSEYGWIRTLVDSLENESDLCSSCETPPELKTYFTGPGTRRFRLFAKCSVTSSFTKFYDDKGFVVGNCDQDEVGSSCNSFNETTAFTFGTNISRVWACEGFDCENIGRFELYDPYEVIIAGDPCGSPIRKMSVSEEFEEYEWIFPNDQIRNESEVIADVSGQYSLVVTNGNGCRDTSSFQVDLGTTFVPKIFGSDVICDDRGARLSMPGYASYEWSNGSKEESTIIYKAGVVSVTVFNRAGCPDVAQLEIRDLRDRTVALKHNLEEIYKGQVIDLSLDLSNFEANEIVSIEWFINSKKEKSTSANLTTSLREMSDIEVVVETQSECVYTDVLTIDPLPFNKTFYAPNVFNPNSISGNDRFYLQGLEGTIKIRKLSVFNRFGMPVYEEKRMELNEYDRGWKGWNGHSNAPEGAYVYLAELVYANGTTEHVSGSVLLVY